MQDISGYGLKVIIRATVTFPQGITLTQFADDADPLDMASIQVADTAMGLNGDLITWSKAIPIPMTLNLIPGSDDDLNMAVLLEANRVGRGKRSARDVITSVIQYADGTSQTVSQGKITNGMPGNSVASSARLKTKPYIFAFENKVNT